MEVVVSTAMVAVILGCSASVLVVALHGIDNGASASVCARQANEALDQITSDLQVAVGVIERTNTSMAVTVPDRTGDGQPETIRYAWSGVAGAPLTKSVNGGAAESMADNVTYFNIDALLSTYGPVESQEMVLTSFDTAAGGTAMDWTVDPQHPCACYFKPRLPTNCVSWRVTRIKFYAMQNGPATESLTVRVRPADANRLPASGPLESVVVPESSLPSAYGWTEVQFLNVAGLGPSTGYCVEVRQTGASSVAATVRYQENGSPLNPDICWLTSSNGGTSWTAANDIDDMRIYVYGTVSTQGPPLWP
jgi:hypothetical protein